MNTPWPTYSAQTLPEADRARPAAVEIAPRLVVARMPMRSATQPISMPPRPVPTQTSAPASAMTERSDASVAWIGFSPTTTSRGAP